MLRIWRVLTVLALVGGFACAAGGRSAAAQAEGEPSAAAPGHGTDAGGGEHDGPQGESAARVGEHLEHALHRAATEAGRLDEEQQQELAHHIETAIDGPSPIQWYTDLAVWTLVVFLLLVGVLWKFAWAPISEALDARERNIRENVEKAEKARDEAAALLEQHRRKLSEVQDEVRAILDEARRDAEHTKSEIVAAAQQEAQATKDRAVRDVQRARDQALQEIAQQAAAMVTDAAGRVIRASLSEADHRRLIEESLSEFGAGVAAE